MNQSVTRKDFSPHKPTRWWNFSSVESKLSKDLNLNLSHVHWFCGQESPAVNHDCWGNYGFSATRRLCPLLSSWNSSTGTSGAILLLRQSFDPIAKCSGGGCTVPWPPSPMSSTVLNSCRSFRGFPLNIYGLRFCQDRSHEVIAVNRRFKSSSSANQLLKGFCEALTPAWAHSI